MDLQTVRAGLAGRPFGHPIHYYPTLPSTMPVARALAAAAADPAHISGALVVADEQTAGRGRLDRRWETPPGRALLLSAVVAGPHLPERPTQLPMIAGLAVREAAAQAVGGAGVRLGLKWPNDLVALLPTGPVKIAGLLAESSLDSRGIRFAILGIGVNVNQRAGELPAPRPGGLPPASLYTLLGREESREALLVGLCHSLSRLLAGPNRPTPGEIHTRWQAELLNLGRAVVVHSSAGAWAGRAVGADLDGSLLVEDDAGRQVAVAAGDVSVVMSDG